MSVEVGEANLLKNLLKPINVASKCTLHNTFSSASRMKRKLERRSCNRFGKDVKCAYRGLPLLIRTHTGVNFKTDLLKLNRYVPKIRLVKLINLHLYSAGTENLAHLGFVHCLKSKIDSNHTLPRQRW
jgi:hypothetical protein